MKKTVITILAIVGALAAIGAVLYIFRDKLKKLCPGCKCCDDECCDCDCDEQAEEYKDYEDVAAPTEE